MIIRFHRKFNKYLEKQPFKVQIKFKKKLEIFVKNRYHYSLNNHALVGKFKDMYSFNVTSDIRVIYEKHGGIIVLLKINSHSELYE